MCDGGALGRSVGSVGGVRGCRRGRGRRQSGEGGSGSGGGEGLPLEGTVGPGRGLAPGLQAAAAAALQGGAGRPGAPGERRRGRAGQRRRPHPVAQDARAHQKLPGAVRRWRGSPRARRSPEVVWWEAPSAGDVIDACIGAVQRLGASLQPQLHPLSLIQLPPALDGRHDGLGEVVITCGGRLGRRQGPEVPQAVAEAGRGGVRVGHVPHGKEWGRGEVA